MTQLTEEQTAALRAKLDPAHVRPPSKFGPKGDYIEGWHAIAEANRIFGHDGWSYTIKSLTCDALDQGKNGKGDLQWQAAYTAIVTLTIFGTVREDVGFGSGFAKMKGDAIEGATKEAVTDALKRALRTWGNPFGLALYDKSRENVGRDDPPPDHAAISGRMISAVSKAGTLADLRRIIGHAKYQESYEALPHDLKQAVWEAEEQAKARIDPAMQAPPDEDAA